MPTVRETTREPPPFPSMLYKPPRSVIGPNEAVVIHKIAQDNRADSEGELVCRHTFEHLQHADFSFYSRLTTPSASL